MQRIGVLTGGGDAPGLNAVIRSVVLTARTQYGISVSGIQDGFEGFLLEDGCVELDEAAVRGILWRGGSILRCNNRFQGDTDEYVRRMRELGLEGLVVAGGDGSLSMAHELHRRGVAVVGVPKTIDNDIVGTDVTFGFDTAVGVVSEACARIIDTASSHHRVQIVEVMGRNSGYLALHGAVSGGADVALLPEIPFAVDSVVDVIDERGSRDRTYTVIVVAEGAHPVGGQLVFREGEKKARNSRLGGIGDWLADALRARVEHEVRSIRLAHLQRGGTPTPFDRNLATMMGVHATRDLLEGRHGVFAALRNGRLASVPLEEAAGKTRRVAMDDPLLEGALNIGIRFGAPYTE